MAVHVVVVNEHLCGVGMADPSLTKVRRFSSVEHRAASLLDEQRAGESLDAAMSVKC
jgi:hypothetical protein